MNDRLYLENNLNAIRRFIQSLYQINNDKMSAISSKLLPDFKSQHSNDSSSYVYG